MLRKLIFLVLAISPATCLSQETSEQTDKIAPDLIAKYHVLKSDYNVKQGMYVVLYKRKTVVASGKYVDGKKRYTWHYYDPAGKLVQHYNFDTNSLIYEAPNDTSSYKISYSFDHPFTKTDTLTRPVRIGGVFYGFAPYLRAFKIDHDPAADPKQYNAIMQVLISPAGRLAECKLLFIGNWSGKVIQTYVITDDILTEEQKLFIPATLNRQPVSSTIFIACKLLPNWNISIY